MIYRLLIFFLLLASACSRPSYVSISGQILNGDSVVSIFVEDSVYKFELDKNNFFSAKIPMKENGYAIFFHNSINLYLAPGEDLEIFADADNCVSSMTFKGSLGTMNRYLKEQEMADFFDPNYYNLDEDIFMKKMNELWNEKTHLLVAKNFEPEFTELEIERIGYQVAEIVSYYPIYRINLLDDKTYRPSGAFGNFLDSFKLNNERFLQTAQYRHFLMNYFSYQTSYQTSPRNLRQVLNGLLSNISSQTVKDYLLTEIILSYIKKNNGVSNAQFLISLYRRECKDPKLLDYMNTIFAQWQKLVPGNEAPYFEVTDVNNKVVKISDFKGSYTYICVWASWCVPCKNELNYLNLLNSELQNKNVRFLTICMDETSKLEEWRNYITSHNFPGVHTIAGAENSFSSTYMIITIPRFILLDPDGKIIDANAPRPSGGILEMMNQLTI